MGDFEEKDRKRREKIESLLEGTDISGRCQVIHLLFERQALILVEKLKARYNGEKKEY